MGRKMKFKKSWIPSAKTKTEALFTRGLYAGLLRAMTSLSADIGAMGEFQMIRRRENEARLNALEQRLEMKYLGVYKSTEEYAPEICDAQRCPMARNRQFDGCYPWPTVLFGNLR